MSKIQSNIGSANKIATSMGHVGDRVSHASLKPIQKASQTTVRVNQEAAHSADQMKKMVTQFGQSFQKDIGHIRSVAREFDRVDREVGGDFSNLQEVGK
ncbi:TIGR04197 family type VII secretion effector [Listeria newyorkensis]|uniref:TIGR04197 family type VII secretion effector n=1 Tax=Listeria newyorkensis TaxID=1497681 RepID=A0A841YWZ2_9LIST|nr:TIGR04197 family type VII secretion effector [Listeria newyorkensis]MBC1457117.1 TIGR04197 family type VII secretion effector [Listeria newyorkensis]